MKIKIFLLAALPLVLTVANFAQQATPTPELYSEKTVKEMRQIRQAAVESDYAYRQVGYLANNIGARLSGSPYYDTRTYFNYHHAAAHSIKSTRRNSPKTRR
ncbi:MAG: hypothetical protein ACR2GG_06935 [Gemmatimonadaceae bacterium]